MTPRRTALRVGQAVLLAVTLGLAGRELARQWDDVQAVAAASTPAWGWIALASVVALAVHASLVQSWRILLSGWDRAPGFWASARIWSVANFGKYLPGKLWSVGALSMLAREAGVSGVAAAGAAILGTLLNIGAGFGVLALSGSRGLHAMSAGLRAATLIGSACFVIGVLALPWVLPPVLGAIARRRGVPAPTRGISRTTLWIATGVNTLAWIGYGLAFACFARGVTPQVAGATTAFITVYTASYLWGYLAFFAPGGIGVREVVLAALLVALGMAASADATFLALASRVWITVLEIVPGLIALLVRPRPATSPVGSAR